MLLLLSGLPGSGKTTLARAYATTTGAAHYNSDALRRELGLMGRYQPGDKEKVYYVLLQRVRQALQQGLDVVVDSTFYRDALREPFRAAARESAVPLRWVEVKADERTIRERLSAPRPDSEADFAVYERIRDQYEPLEEEHLTVWSDLAPLPQLVEQLRAYTGRHEDRSN